MNRSDTTASKRNCVVAEIPPSVVDHEANAAGIEHVPVPGSEVGGGHRRDLRHHLDQGRVGDAERRCGAGADPRRHADERHAARRRVKEQRDQSLAALAPLRGAATEDVVVVEAELEVVAGVDDRDDPRCAFESGTKRLAGGEVHQRRTQRIEDGDGQERDVSQRTRCNRGTAGRVGQYHVCDGREQEQGS